MKEKALIIDQDLKIHLENKICSSFLKFTLTKN